ncbi:MAG: tetratricopeptide repeat protein [Anaerolineales bacterium]|nr:tetratricopeptide repeat protein [Anaerolineales bacterium]
MNPHTLILAIGIFYTIIFGLLSLLRREGLSTQFAIEVLVLTVLVEGISLALGVTVDPLPFLIFIYLVSMRGRLLVDLANFLSSRGRQRDAIRLLELALQLFPDHSTRLVILVNMGIVQLRRESLESARALFEEVLRDNDARGGLGIKYEAACRYNLGLALMQLGKEAEAVRQFNEVMVIFPNSIFSRAAEAKLEKRRRGRRTEPDSPADERDQAS